jgi:ribonuclease HI
MGEGNNNEAEGFALLLALDYLDYLWETGEAQLADGWLIFSDSAGVVGYLLKSWACPLSWELGVELRKKYYQIKKRMKLRIFWIRGHNDIPGNEEADQYAKKGAKGATEMFGTDWIPRVTCEGTGIEDPLPPPPPPPSCPPPPGSPEMEGPTKEAEGTMIRILEKKVKEDLKVGNNDSRIQVQFPEATEAPSAMPGRKGTRPEGDAEKWQDRDNNSDEDRADEQNKKRSYHGQQEETRERQGNRNHAGTRPRKRSYQQEEGGRGRQESRERKERRQYTLNRDRRRPQLENAVGRGSQGRRERTDVIQRTTEAKREEREMVEAELRKMVNRVGQLELGKEHDRQELVILKGQAANWKEDKRELVRNSEAERQEIGEKMEVMKKERTAGEEERRMLTTQNGQLLAVILGIAEGREKVAASELLNLLPEGSKIREEEGKR